MDHENTTPCDPIRPWNRRNLGHLMAESRDHGRVRLRDTSGRRRSRRSAELVGRGAWPQRTPLGSTPTNPPDSGRAGADTGWSRPRVGSPCHHWFPCDSHVDSGFLTDECEPRVRCHWPPVTYRSIAQGTPGGGLIPALTLRNGAIGEDHERRMTAPIWGMSANGEHESIVDPRPVFLAPAEVMAIRGRAASGRLRPRT
jgi:hypothetical protein